MFNVVVVEQYKIKLIIIKKDHKKHEMFSDDALVTATTRIYMHEREREIKTDQF